MKNGMVFLLVFVVMMGSLSLIVVVVGVPLPGLDNHNRFRFIQQDAPDWNGGNISPSCTQSPDTGPCRASFPRFYWNGASCSSFVWGGCAGNGNRFQTIEQCTATCASAG
ncbi:KappaPI-theraphotoxin-Hs1a [Folsomia candida]|uniref:KappaPI-theraphotoxin-Hs1a n=1 Tax=Folsomia candida TaxID=158441 RepID=A0A226E2N4_FOLCA|nr:KappaPI-theraphotoxin-Hs1a [Folsomia candida]